MLPSALCQDYVGQITLLWIGKPDTNLEARVAGFVEANTGCKVRKLAEPYVLESFEAETNRLARLSSKDDVCLVALFNTIQTNMAFCKAVFQADRIGICNIGLLRNEDAIKSQADQEIADRRVEKESMNIIGTLIGLPPCPFPLCVMHSSQSLEDLDSKGRNFCPPCHSKSQDLLTAAKNAK